MIKTDHHSIKRSNAHDRPANDREWLTEVWPDGYRAIVREIQAALIRDDDDLSGHAIAHLLHDAYANTYTELGAPFWRMVARVAEAEIVAYFRQLPQPESLAGALMGIDSHMRSV